eukprot:3934103-Rhodomonas_salina.1
MRCQTLRLLLGAAAIQPDPSTAQCLATDLAHAVVPERRWQSRWPTSRLPCPMSGSLKWPTFTVSATQIQRTCCLVRASVRVRETS